MPRTRIYGKKNPINFDFEVKGQGHIDVMMVPDSCLMVIHPCAKYGMPMSKN